MVIVAGTIQIDPAQRELLESAFDRMRQATLAEPGCIEYQAYADRHDRGTILIFERWQDDAALQAHFASAHMAEFRTTLAGATLLRRSFRRYEVVGDGVPM